MARLVHNNVQVQVVLKKRFDLSWSLGPTSPFITKEPPCFGQQGGSFCYEIEGCESCLTFSFGHTLFVKRGLQFACLEHFHHDIATAKKFAFDV